MKTRNTKIWWPAITENKVMTEAEIDNFINDRKDHIRATFKWENYPAHFSHLVLAVRYDNDNCIIYPQGYLMTDDEFEQKVVLRKDIKIERVTAYHKGTAKF